MSKTRIRRVVVTLIASVVAITGLVMAPSVAFAGSNGQQVEVCNQSYASGVNVAVLGFNQNGLLAETPEFHLNYNTWGGCYYEANYWFRGPTYVIINGTTTMQCGDVPQQMSSDVYKACSV